MAKEKEKKVREKINWKKEFKLAPGYIVIILWVIFTFMLLGWILAASLSTTADIFAGKALKFPSGLHFENYAQAWGSGGVATFFMNSLLYAPVSYTHLDVYKRQRLVSPVIGDVVVHLRRIPDGIYEEGNRVFMERHGFLNRDNILFLVNGPVGCRYDIACGAVDNFPPFLRVMHVVGDHLLAIIAIEEINGN